ncbi:hypothetical protein V6Z12_D11G181700 [Gossypium hirsutum]
MHSIFNEETTFRESLSECPIFEALSKGKLFVLSRARLGLVFFNRMTFFFL